MKIKAILMDVYGVLTDNKKYYLANGSVTKVFSVEDGEGILKAQKNGIICGIVTADGWNGIYQRAKDLGINRKDVFITTMDKVQAVKVFCGNHGIMGKEICFIGNSIEDIRAMNYCGMWAVPGSTSYLKDFITSSLDNGYISGYTGGNGAVRDIIEHILRDINK
jgi:3-deoxy-D-manno-octulosonate 8-phosphate phosphatase (KDO 8-P phosphatase)